MPFWDPVTGDYVNDPLLGDQLMAPAFPEKPLAAPAAPVFDPNLVVDPPPQVVAPVSAVPQQATPVSAPGVSTRVGNRSSVDVSQSGVNLGKAQQIADFSSKMGRAYAPIARQAADLAKAEQESITEQTRLQQEAVDINRAAKEQKLARDTALDTEYETKRKVYEDAIKIGHAKATEAENAARAKHEAAFQQWASMKVEPDRLTRDNSIGVAMVAFADGFLKARGVNSDAMATLNTRINRDIEAQKYAIEHQGNVTEGFKRLYDIARAHTQSEDQFNTLMYEGYVRSGINYLERQKALATSKAEIAALEASKKQLEASAHAARVEAQSRSLQNNLNIVNHNTDKAHKDAQLAIQRDQARLAREEFEAKKEAEKAKATYTPQVPGLAPLTDKEGNLVRDVGYIAVNPALNKENVAKIEVEMKGQAAIVRSMQPIADALEEAGLSTADMIAQNSKYLAWAATDEAKTRMQQAKFNIQSFRRSEQGQSLTKQEQENMDAIVYNLDQLKDGREMAKALSTFTGEAAKGWYGNARYIAVPGTPIPGEEMVVGYLARERQPLKQDAEIAGEILSPGNFKVDEPITDAAKKYGRGDFAKVAPGNEKASGAYDSLRYNLVKGDNKETAYQIYVAAKLKAEKLLESSKPGGLDPTDSDYAPGVAASNLLQDLSRNNGDRMLEFASRYKKENPPVSGNIRQSRLKEDFRAGKRSLSKANEKTQTKSDKSDDSYRE